MIYTTLGVELKIEEHESHTQNMGALMCTKGKQFLSRY
jgi:hypothetical protein